MINGEETITVKVYDARMEKEDSTLEPGFIVSNKKELKIATREGFLIIDSLKLAGKRKMDTKSLLNGYTFLPGSKMV